MFQEEQGQDGERFYDELYLWVRPSEENLHFIEQQTLKYGCSRLVSIGCGSGLLEWLIHKATNLEVIGVEVDRSWWESGYAPPTFLPLYYADEVQASDVITSSNSTLLFCYFNNGPAFTDYMKRYNGNCFIVIGPGEGRGTHTNPSPFNVQLEDQAAWNLVAFQEIQHTKDFITVYVRAQYIQT
ncbi:uncharacterized protein [Periplaneta americana]